LLREENEAQAEVFLAASPDFALYPASRAWAETIGGRSPGGDDYLRLTPARHGTDGFFVAQFERHSPHPNPLPLAGEGANAPPPRSRSRRPRARRTSCSARAFRCWRSATACRRCARSWADG